MMVPSTTKLLLRSPLVGMTSGVPVNFGPMHCSLLAEGPVEAMEVLIHDDCRSIRSLAGGRVCRI